MTITSSGGKTQCPNPSPPTASPTSAKSTPCCATRCGASSPTACCRTATPGRSRASCRARSCARWARSVCSACATRPSTAAPGLDTLANVVLAEELGRCTYGGFAVTVLVHTDMASPHLYHGGTPDQLARWMPDITAGRKITAVAMTEADAGSDLASMRTSARKVDGGYRAERRQDVHHQRRARRPLFRRRQDRRGRAAAIASRCSPSRRARPASASRARSRSTAGCAATPPSWCSRTASCRTRT